MYASYWNLREKPFQNVADIRFAYLSDQHREGLARLVYLVDERKLGGVLVGPYGVGKSMILEMLWQNLRNKSNVHYIKLDTPLGGTISLAKQVALRLGYNGPVSDSADALNVIQSWCSKQSSNMPQIVLALDEAQLLSQDSACEFLHLMTNIRVAAPDGGAVEPAVTLVLSGHSDLMRLIAQNEPLRQRLQVYWELKPLTETQTMEYVHHRIRAAGGDIWMCDEESIHELHQASQGIPRVINNICDIALLVGCSRKATKLDRDIMIEAAKESNLPISENYSGKAD